MKLAPHSLYDLATDPSHVMWGCHSGYFFLPEKLQRESVDMLFAALEANPHYKAVMELEPYTIKRMKEGEKFPFEKFRRENSTIRDEERLEKLRRYVKLGRIEITRAARSTCGRQKKQILINEVFGPQ